MEENNEMVEKISEETVNELLANENVGGSTLPIIIIGVATLGVGFLIYKGIKYYKNKHSYVEVTPDQIRNISNEEDEVEE